MVSVYTKVAYYSGSENYSDAEFARLQGWMQTNVGDLYKDWAYVANGDNVEIIIVNKVDLAPLVALRWS